MMKQQETRKLIYDDFDSFSVEDLETALRFLKYARTCEIPVNAFFEIDDEE